MPACRSPEAAVGEDADHLLIAALRNQARGGLALRLVHLQGQGVAAGDGAERLRAARRRCLHAENLVSARLQIARLSCRHCACDFGLGLSLDACFARLPLQGRAEGDARDLDAGRRYTVRGHNLSIFLPAIFLLKLPWQAEKWRAEKYSQGYA
jgi:hypothetical protein